MNPSPPGNLYKYRTFNEFGLRLLTHDEIYFASPKDLNDPFDCRNPIRFEIGTEKQMYYKNCEHLKLMRPDLAGKERKRLSRKLAKTTYRNRDNKGNRKAFRDRVYEDINQTKGIFSLSAVNDHVPMWSHYSDCHQGFCVGFNTKELNNFMNSVLLSGIFLFLDKIEYFKKMPILNPYKMSSEELVKKMLCSKGEEWAYEKEYRVVSGEKASFKLKINSNIISSIYLGVKCSEVNKAKLITILNKRGNKVPLYSGVLTDTSVIMFKEIKY